MTTKESPSLVIQQERIHFYLFSSFLYQSIYVELIVGGASTNYQILSAESRKYFRNAIPMSGSIGNLWALSPESHLTRVHQILEEELGEPKRSNEELLEYFKTAPPQFFNKISRVEVNSGMQYTVPFGPVVESKLN